MKKNRYLFYILFLMTYACSSHGHGDGDDHHSGGGSGHWDAPMNAVSMKNPTESTLLSTQLGQKLFEQKCSGCHGTDQDDPNDFKGENSPPYYRMLGLHQDGEIAWKIKTGRGNMPAWKDRLNDGEIWNIVNYLKSIK